MVKRPDFGPEGTRFEPYRVTFLFKTGYSKIVQYTVNNALTKITGQNSGLFARYFSTAVLQQCFRKAYSGQKSGYLYSIFERPIFDLIP